MGKKNILENGNNSWYKEILLAVRLLTVKFWKVP